MPSLNRQLASTALRTVAAESFELPERAVQFGTGAFLRGFVDAILDEANRTGQFGGRVVAVGTTGSGREQTLNAQNGLYTLSLRGRSKGVSVRQDRVVAAVSRALRADTQWTEVLQVARNPDLELVFSNTTEIGITLTDDAVPGDTAPRSFPGKLTRFLYERAAAFDFSSERGLVVLPCELIEENGDQLKTIVLALASRWRLGAPFSHWLETAVPFCNTLVDRIVPGTPAPHDLQALWEELGYIDHLVTIGEPYCLFAIEADQETRARLRFAAHQDGTIVTDDIAPYRDRKVRLLNGAHTLLAPVGLLSGCHTVFEAIEQQCTGTYLRRALLEELVPSVYQPGAREFATTVLERLANPAIEHALSDVMLQATTKWRVRVLPALQDYARRHGHAPPLIAFGFAGFLLLHRDQQGSARLAADERAGPIAEAWRTAGVRADAAESVTRLVCSDTSLWPADLNAVPGFVKQVTDFLARMIRNGVPATLASFIEQRAVAAGS